jgi:hypothetical protein
VERRLTASITSAALLHATLLLGGARLTSGAVPSPSPSSARLDVELLYEHVEPPEPVLAPIESPPEPASSALAARIPPRARAHRTPLRAPPPAAGASSADTGFPEASSGEEPTSAAAGGGSQELGAGDGEPSSPPIDLGLDGSVARWALEAEQARQRAQPKDVAGLARALMQSDTELGRGPGFEIAARLLERGRDLAPLDSAATAEFSIEADGSISSATLVDTRSSPEAWQRVLRDLCASLPRLRQAPHRRLRARIWMQSKGSARSGTPSGPGNFDVSNIGSVQHHWFHVTVLAQIPE